MPKKPPISDDDLAAFHKEMEGVKPLVHKKIRIAKPKPQRKLIKPRFEDENPLRLNERHPATSVASEEFISYKQPAIANKILRKLRKGQYNVEAILDLHGMSVDEARIAVESFLQQCLRKEIRVALIIHGKGHHSPLPILKNKLNQWLREIYIVLAFCSAAPGHGSRGAIYVLLKHMTEENSA